MVKTLQKIGKGIKLQVESKNPHPPPCPSPHQQPPRTDLSAFCTCTCMYWLFNQFLFLNSIITDVLSCVLRFHWIIIHLGYFSMVHMTLPHFLKWSLGISLSGWPPLTFAGPNVQTFRRFPEFSYHQSEATQVTWHTNVLTMIIFKSFLILKHFLSHRGLWWMPGAAEDI